jgi:hypothetical protein
MPAFVRVGRARDLYYRTRQSCSSITVLEVELQQLHDCYQRLFSVKGTVSSSSVLD